MLLSNNTISLPALLLAAGVTFSAPVISSLTTASPISSVYTECDTTSSSANEIEYGNRYSAFNPRKQAMELFGEQSNYTKEERQTYINMLEAKAENVGKNIADFF